MFDDIINAISTAFTITLILFIILIVIAVIKGIENGQKRTEQIQKEQIENQNLINTIISESKQFPTEVLISQRDEVLRAYNELYNCKQNGLMKKKEYVWIRVGNKIGCPMDLKTCYTVLEFLSEEINKRSN